jgi:hypothetical protein
MTRSSGRVRRPWLQRQWPARVPWRTLGTHLRARRKGRRSLASDLAAWTKLSHDRRALAIHCEAQGIGWEEQAASQGLPIDREGLAQHVRCTRYIQLHQLRRGEPVWQSSPPAIPAAASESGARLEGWDSFARAAHMPGGPAERAMITGGKQRTGGTLEEWAPGDLPAHSFRPDLSLLPPGTCTDSLSFPMTAALAIKLSRIEACTGKLPNASTPTHSAFLFEQQPFQSGAVTTRRQRSLSTFWGLKTGLNFLGSQSESAGPCAAHMRPPHASLTCTFLAQFLAPAV